MNKNKTKYQLYCLLSKILTFSQASGKSAISSVLGLYSIVGLIGLLSFSSSKAAVHTRQFEAPMGQERWEVKATRLRCGLSQKLKDYGIAYFEQHATKDPQFLLTNWQAEQGVRDASVWTVPPVWNAARRPELITTTSLTGNKFALDLSGKPTLMMLAGLAEGYRSRIHYKSGMGYQVKVYISPINFQTAYTDYMRCIVNLLPFNFDEIKDTVIGFSNDYYGLTDEDKGLLDRVQLYSSVDKDIYRIEIVGHSDNIGRRGVNNAISELRAKHVYDYLVRRGVPKEKLHVTWYGMENPIASNRTEEGRAKNRRVEVTVFK